MPDNADAAGTLGWILFRQGVYREALQFLERACTEDRGSKAPNAVIRRYHLAMTYLKLGDRQKGLELLARAIQQNPSLPEAQMARALVR